MPLNAMAPSSDLYRSSGMKQKYFFLKVSFRFTLQLWAEAVFMQAGYGIVYRAVGFMAEFPF